MLHHHHHHHNGNAKLDAHKVRQILGLRAEGWSYPRLAREFKVSGNTIQRICTGQSWQSVTGGQEILTDGEVQLRQLNTPQPSPEEIQASMEKVNKLMGQAGDSSSSSSSIVPPQYQRPQEETYAQELSELIEQAKERREKSGGNGEPVPPPIPTRQVEMAEKLLETLKDETLNRPSTIVPPAAPE